MGPVSIGLPFKVLALAHATGSMSDGIKVLSEKIYSGRKHAIFGLNLATPYLPPL